MATEDRYRTQPSGTARKALGLAIAALVIAILALLLVGIDLLSGP
jgi:hypothetical protein